MSTYVMLGRFGDVCNILPLLKSEADAGRRPTLVIAKEFEGILDGVSYVDRIVFPGINDQLPRCLEWLRETRGITEPIISQTHRHPTEHHRKTTDSYQKECWRLAGRLSGFETRGPLVFDQRNALREELLLKTFPSARNAILIALDSISSPFHKKNIVGDALTCAFPDRDFLDVSEIRADRIYDLLGLYENAACLVSVDTVHLHLSRASSVPLVALVNNGWYGSVVEHAKQAIRYATATPDLVVEAVRNTLSVHA